MNTDQPEIAGAGAVMTEDGKLSVPPSDLDVVFSGKDLESSKCNARKELVKVGIVFKMPMSDTDDGKHLVVEQDEDSDPTAAESRRFLVNSEDMQDDNCTGNSPSKTRSKGVANKQDAAKHKGAKPKLKGFSHFTCSECNKTFKSETSLEGHKKKQHLDTKGLSKKKKDRHNDKKTHACDVCSKIFDEIRKLKRHMLSHKRSKDSFLCQYCTQSFKQERHCKRHEALHVTDNAIKCLSCSSIFKDVDELKEHIVQHRNKKMEPFSCSLCHKNFVSKQKMNSHVKICKHKDCSESAKSSQNGDSDVDPHSRDARQNRRKIQKVRRNHKKEQKVKTDKSVKTQSENDSKLKDPNSLEARTCKVCGKVFARTANVLVHMKLHTGEKPFSCSICGKLFRRSDHLKAHEQVHMKKEPYRCDLCNETFKRKDRLKYHQINYHGAKIYLNELKSYSRLTQSQPQCKTDLCEICGISFANEKNLKNHLKLHSNAGRFPCPYCGKTFNQSSNLNIHLRKHTGETPYKCLHCDQSFATSAKLKTHALKHTGDLSFTCEVCGRLFGENHLLKMHMRIHSDHKPYICSHCNKTFTHSSTLRAHVRTHTGAKPYKCDQCGDAFAQISSLKYHKRKHSGEKPYSCHICGNSYTRMATLNVHLTRHSGQKRISCLLCDFKCDFPKHLRKHVAKAHNKLQDSVDLMLTHQKRGRASDALYAKSIIDPVVPDHKSSNATDCTGNLATHLAQIQDQGHFSSGNDDQASYTQENMAPSNFTSLKNSDCVMDNFASLKSENINIATRETNATMVTLQAGNSDLPDGSSTVTTNLFDSTGSAAGNVYNPPSFADGPMMGYFNSGTFPNSNLQTDTQQQAMQVTTSNLTELENAQMNGVTNNLDFSGITYPATAVPLLQSISFSDSSVPSFSQDVSLAPSLAVQDSNFNTFGSTDNPAQQHMASNALQPRVNNAQLDPTFGEQNQLCAPEVLAAGASLGSSSLVNTDRGEDLQAEVSDDNDYGTIKGNETVEKAPQKTGLDIHSGEVEAGREEHNMFDIHEEEDVELKTDEEETEKAKEREKDDEDSESDSDATVDFEFEKTKKPLPISTRKHTRALRSNTRVLNAKATKVKLKSAKNKKRLYLFKVRNAKPQERLKSECLQNKSRQSESPHTKSMKSKVDESSIRVSAGRKKRAKKGKGPIECHVCGQKFSRTGNLTTHMRLHSGERPYACKICDKRYTRSDHLKSHMQLHKGDSCMLCNHCGDVFNSIDQLQTHTLKNHGGKNPFACNLCDFSSVHLSELKDHVRSHKDKDPFRCDICEISFIKSKELKKHMESHDGKSPFICDTCNKSFRESSCLKLHIMTKHTGEKHFKCGVCGDTFVTAAKLQRHMRTHSGSRPYACEFCGKMFIDTCLLKMHARIHTKEKPFQCKHCEQCFTHRSTLRAHVRTHTGTKPYKCEICNATFAQVSSLTYHKRRHDGLKPYTCHICGNSYTRSTTLNIHMTRHTGQKRISCPHCMFKCDMPKYLRKHIAKAHSGSGNEESQQARQQEASENKFQQPVRQSLSEDTKAGLDPQFHRSQLQQVQEQQGQQQQQQEQPPNMQPQHDQQLQVQHQEVPQQQQQQHQQLHAPPQQILFLPQIPFQQGFRVAVPVQQPQLEEQQHLHKLHQQQQQQQQQQHQQLFIQQHDNKTQLFQQIQPVQLPLQQPPLQPQQQQQQQQHQQHQQQQQQQNFIYEATPEILRTLLTTNPAELVQRNIVFTPTSSLNHTF